MELNSAGHLGLMCVPCTAQSLLPKIVELWEALCVPLVHRSRFYLAFQGRETFYFEAEHRRLCYLRSQMKPTDAVSSQAGTPNRSFAKAQRKLDVRPTCLPLLGYAYAGLCRAKAILRFLRMLLQWVPTLCSHESSSLPTSIMHHLVAFISVPKPLTTLVNTSVMLFNL